MLECFQLLHFHLGSQITNIRTVKAAMVEGCRVFVELHKAGATLKYLDIGGGMAVDYDGSSSNFPSSMNYTLQEYAADVVSAVMEACTSADVPHPTIVTEAGRAVTAHHSVLVFDVRDRALIAHETQVDPESFWFVCPLEFQQRAWPTEDYELARSLVDTTMPEDDLFAGIREKVGS